MFELGKWLLTPANFWWNLFFHIGLGLVFGTINALAFPLGWIAWAIWAVYLTISLSLFWNKLANKDEEDTDETEA